MTIQELATCVNYQKSSIYELVKKRKISYIKPSGKLHFKKNMIDEWLDNRKIKTKSEIEKMADHYIFKNSL